MKNKMLWLLSLVLALLLLTGCFMPKQNKALESKLMEAESKVLNLENQVALMVQNLTDSQNEVLKLQSEQSAKDEKILQLESQLEEAEKNSGMSAQADEDKNLLLSLFAGLDYDQYNHVGIMCNGFDSYEYDYLDPEGLKEELMNNLGYSLNEDPSAFGTSSSNIWAGIPDERFEVSTESFLFVYLIGYEDPDYGSNSYIFNISLNCYEDYPALEKYLININ